MTSGRPRNLAAGGDEGVHRRTVTIGNRRGLHARASAKFVKLATAFDAEVTVAKDGTRVCGTSIMGLLMLAASSGAAITMEAEGAEAAKALDALAQLVAGHFGED